MIQRPLKWIRASWIAAAIAALVSPKLANAWGAELTHEELATRAIERVDSNGDFSRYLIEQLNLGDGLDSSLTLNPVFGPNIDFRRLTHSANSDFWKQSPRSARLVIGQAAPSIDQLIRAGVWAEDNPNPRARHHFHDPTFEHDPPNRIRVRVMHPCCTGAEYPWRSLDTGGQAPRGLASRLVRRQTPGHDGAHSVDPPG